MLEFLILSSDGFHNILDILVFLRKDIVIVQPTFDRSNRIDVVADRSSLFGCAARFVYRHSVGAILDQTPKINYLI